MESISEKFPKINLNELEGQLNMSKSKVAEVRANSKTGIVLIKMNKGPNHILEGEKALRFNNMRGAYMCDGNSHSEASYMAAQDYLAGRIK